MEKITLVTFTDPMMGLSYECEPIFRKLETHFAEKIDFRYVMSGLVRDVYDFVDPDDLKRGNDFAIRNYNVKLAKIYESEEKLGGLPINMTGFELFSTTETSSAPLNIAYKAIQLVDNAKSDEFLYRLRFATVVECKPTTKLPEILKVVVKTGVNVKNFLSAYNGEAKIAFQSDLNLCERLEIRSLPSYLIQFGSKGALIRGLASFSEFANVIYEFCGLKASPPEKNLENLRSLLKKHPLISPIELQEAFGFKNTEEIRKFIAPIVASGEFAIKKVPRGWFIEKNLEETT